MATGNLFAPNSREGAALSGLLTSLYSGDGAAKRAEREAMLETRRLDQTLKRAQIDKYQSEKAEKEAAGRAEAEAMSNMFRGALGGAPQGDAALAFFKAGGMQSPEVAGRPPMDDEGFAMPQEQMPRPAGYSPEIESRLTNDIYNIAKQRQLTGKTNLEQFARAGQTDQIAQVVRDVLEGKMPAQAASAAVAAGAGRPMYHDTGGRVLNTYSGALNEGGAQATAGVVKTQAEAEQERAQAGLQRAQTGAILPNQTVTGPGGVTFPVSGGDISRNITASMFGPKAPSNDPNASPTKLKPGERWNPTEQRVEAVEGTAEYVRRANLHANDQGGLAAMRTKVDSAKQKIDEILSDETGFEANFGGYNAYATRLLPGDARQGARIKIESLKSDIKAAGLELMRAGGSIGQITQAEWPIVEGMIARIDPMLGEDAAKHELERVKVYLENIVANSESKYQTEWGGSQFAPSGARPVMGADQAPMPAAGEPTATDAQGNKVVFRNGQWQPLR